MSLKNCILFIFGIAICSRSSAKFCIRRYVDGKWVSKGDCGGPQTKSDIQSELQGRAQREEKRIADKEWTVFQRRQHGNVDFNRGWFDYVKGFGNRDGDFWLGLDKLYERTKEGNMELEINAITKVAETLWVVKCSNFGVGPSNDNYRLQVSGCSGNKTGYGILPRSKSQQFSTRDADHDPMPGTNCASGHHEGGWWHGVHCAYSSLNGNFRKTGVRGFWWWDGTYRQLRFSEMKFRARS